MQQSKKFTLQVEDFHENVNLRVFERVWWENKVKVQRARGRTHQESRGSRHLPPAEALHVAPYCAGVQHAASRLRLTGTVDAWSWMTGTDKDKVSAITLLCLRALRLPQRLTSQIGLDACAGE